MVGELHERCLDFGVLSQPSKALYTKNWSGVGYPMICERTIYIFVHCFIFFPSFCRDSLLTTDNSPSSLANVCVSPSLVVPDILSSFVPDILSSLVPIQNQHFWS